MTQGSSTIRRYNVVGSRRLSNYWWATVILIGGLGFFITGLSSFSKTSVLPFVQFQTITFFPQGLVMSFYGVLGVLFSSYLWFTIICNIGSGFNEINKKERMVRVFRWGFPGKNRRIDLSYPIADIESVKLELKEGINPKRTVYLRLKGIPLESLASKKGTVKEATREDQGSQKIPPAIPFQGKAQEFGKNQDANKGIKRDIPLNRIDQRMTLQETEQEVSELARFLQVSLELN